MKMHIETNSSYVTPAHGNVFVDLGFSAEEAEGLKANSTSIILMERQNSGIVKPDVCTTAVHLNQHRD
jgi:hypothetical protein